MTTKIEVVLLNFQSYCVFGSSTQNIYFYIFNKIMYIFIHIFTHIYIYIKYLKNNIIQISLPNCP